MNTNIADHPIFIYGHEKAGTSLMLYLLDGHPEIVAYPIEPYFYGRFARKVYGLNKEERYKQAVVLIHKHHHNEQWRFGDVSFEKHKAAFDERLALTDGTIRDHIAAIVLAYGDVAQLITDETRHWTEKTPGHARYAQYAFSEWPAARCIHLIRDPRDNFISYNIARTEHWGQDAVAVVEFARRWKTEFRLAHENQQRHGKDRYLILQYEDLVGQPEQNVNHIAAFLGVKTHDTMYKPTRRGKLWAGNSVHDNSFGGISKAPIGRWEQASNMEELAFLEGLLEDAMRSLGYTPAIAKSPQLRASITAIRAIDWAERKVRYIHRQLISPQRRLPTTLQVASRTGQI